MTVHRRPLPRFLSNSQTSVLPGADLAPGHQATACILAAQCLGHACHSYVLISRLANPRRETTLVFLFLSKYRSQRHKHFKQGKHEAQEILVPGMRLTPKGDSDGGAWLPHMAVVHPASGSEAKTCGLRHGDWQNIILLRLAAGTPRLSTHV